MSSQAVHVVYVMFGCPLNPLYKEGEDPAVDRNRPPSLIECRLCEHHEGEEDLIVTCGYEGKEATPAKEYAKRKCWPDKP